MKKRDIWVSTAILAGSAFLLYFYFQGTGRIEIRAAGAEAVLDLSSNLFGKTTIRSEASPADIHTGLHRPKSLKLSIQREGSTRQLESSGPWGRMSTLKVKRGDTAVIEVGPPFTIKPVVSGAGPDVFIGLAIFGRAGEQYQNVIMQDGKRASAPALEVVDEKGSVVTTGKFEYG